MKMIFHSYFEIKINSSRAMHFNSISVSFASTIRRCEGSAKVQIIAKQDTEIERNRKWNTKKKHANKSKMIANLKAVTQVRSSSNDLYDERCVYHRYRRIVRVCVFFKNKNSFVLASAKWRATLQMSVILSWA